MSENTAAPAAEKKEQEGGKTVLRAVTFGGFNRADVLDFIEKQKKVEADLKKKIEELEGRFASEGSGAAPQTDEALQAELAAAKEKIASLENEAKALRGAAAAAVPAAEGAEGEKIAELAAAVSAAEKEKAALAEAVAEKDAKIAELTAKLNAPAAPGSPEAQIGAVLLEARRCADEMIAAAKLEESRIRAQAFVGIQKTQKTVQGICDELDIFFERSKRNAELARTTMGELNEKLDAEVKKFTDPSGSGKNVE